MQPPRAPSSTSSFPTSGKSLRYPWATFPPGRALACPRGIRSRRAGRLHGLQRQGQGLADRFHLPHGRPSRGDGAGRDSQDDTECSRRARLRRLHPFRRVAKACGIHGLHSRPGERWHARVVSDLGVLVDFMAFNAKAKGSPIDFIFPTEGLPAVTEPVAILKTTQNAAAARAFVDFILSDEGQKLAVSMGYIPARASVGMPAWYPISACWSTSWPSTPRPRARRSISSSPRKAFPR